LIHDEERCAILAFGHWAQKSYVLRSVLRRC
jgi:hypothetical protein